MPLSTFSPHGEMPGYGEMTKAPERYFKAWEEQANPPCLVSVTASAACLIASPRGGAVGV